MGKAIPNAEILVVREGLDHQSGHRCHAGGGRPARQAGETPAPQRLGRDCDQGLREDGSAFAPGEPSELVHRGVHVALGYWNDIQKPAERFKPAPDNSPASLSEKAILSMA